MDYKPKANTNLWNEISQDSNRFEQSMDFLHRKQTGSYYTSMDLTLTMMQELVDSLDDTARKNLYSRTFFEPCVGTGNFVFAYLRVCKELAFSEEENLQLINNIYACDINSGALSIYKANLKQFVAEYFGIELSEEYFATHIGTGLVFDVAADKIKYISITDVFSADIIKNGFDIVITNPPFGSKTPVDDQRVLHQYKIQKYGSASPRSSLPPEQLFVERCLDFLKPGGYLGIVLPDSILSNPGLIWLRDWIFTKAYIIASIDLPQETFEPHTGTQTSILILKKKTKEEELRIDEYSIFMTIPEKVGHDKRGNPVYKITPDGEIEIDKSGNNIIDDDLQFISDLFKKWIKEKGMV